MVEALDTVDAAVAVGLPFDAVNGRIGPGGQLITTWPIVGGTSGAVTLVRGRWPQPGEALVSATARERAGLVDPSAISPRAPPR